MRLSEAEDARATSKLILLGFFHINTPHLSKTPIISSYFHTDPPNFISLNKHPFPVTVYFVMLER